MRSGVLTSTRPTRRALGLLGATLALTVTVATGCSDNEPSGPAISGDSPAEVTVPTLPPTTTEAPDGPGLEDTDTTAPTTTEAAE